jgi:hypothetical protein
MEGFGDDPRVQAEALAILQRAILIKASEI